MTEHVSLRQGTQYRSGDCRIGVIAVEPGPAGLLAKIGVSTPTERSAHLLAEGDRVPLPDGRVLHLAGIAVAPDGRTSAALLEFEGDAR